MQITKLKPVFYALAVISGIVGIVMYFSSIFSGFFLILLALVIYYLYRLLATDLKTVKSDIIPLLKNLLIPLIGMASAIIIGAIIMALTGYDPIKAYKALFYGGFVKNWSISILNATPLVFTGLSIAFAFKAGLFNIGAEGQYYIGAMVATFLGITFNLPPVLSLFLIFIIGGLLAAAYNFIPALLKVKTGAHEVITTMMFANIAKYLSSIFVRGMGGDSAGPHPYVTDPILDSNFLMKFKRSEEHTSELQSHSFISYAVFCLKKKKTQ